MNEIKVYRSYNGWIYQLWFQGRCVVVGCCKTEAAAYKACHC